jgi:hypothetical protein
LRATSCNEQKGDGEGPRPQSEGEHARGRHGFAVVRCTKRNLPRRLHQDSPRARADG